MNKNNYSEEEFDPYKPDINLFNTLRQKREQLKEEIINQNGSIENACQQNGIDEKIISAGIETMYDRSRLLSQGMLKLGDVLFFQNHKYSFIFLINREIKDSGLHSNNNEFKIFGQIIDKNMNHEKKKIYEYLILDNTFTKIELEKESLNTSNDTYDVIHGIYNDYLKGVQEFNLGNYSNSTEYFIKCNKQIEATSDMWGGISEQERGIIKKSATLDIMGVATCAQRDGKTPLLEYNEFSDELINKLKDKDILKSNVYNRIKDDQIQEYSNIKIMFINLLIKSFSNGILSMSIQENGQLFRKNIKTGCLSVIYIVIVSLGGLVYGLLV